MAKRTVSALKKRLWKIFAEYIKRKYSEDGIYCKCFTCGATMEIGTSNCQAAHYLPKGGYPYHYFNEENVRPGCFRCNISLLGNTVAFRENLIAEIGEDKVLELENTRHTREKRGVVYYEEKIEEYKKKLEEIKGA